MQEYAFYVRERAVISRDGDGVWMELPTGTAWLQFHLTRHVGLVMANHLQSVLLPTDQEVLKFNQRA